MTRWVTTAMLGLLVLALPGLARGADAPERVDAQMLLDLELLRNPDLAKSRDLYRRMNVVERMRMLEMLQVLESDSPPPSNVPAQPVRRPESGGAR